MKTKENKMEGCNCGQKMQDDIKGMVKEGEGPTPQEREQKKREVESAFKTDKK